MKTYRVPVRRTTTEFGYAYVEAHSPEEARDEFEENASEGMIGAFDVEELLEEQYDVVEDIEPDVISS